MYVQWIGNGKSHMPCLLFLFTWNILQLTKEVRQVGRFVCVVNAVRIFDK